MKKGPVGIVTVVYLILFAAAVLVMLLPTDLEVYPVVTAVLEILLWVILTVIVLVCILWICYLIFGKTEKAGIHMGSLNDMLEDNKHNIMAFVTLLGVVGVYELLKTPPAFLAEFLRKLPLEEILTKDALFGHYAAQLSLTFITISVMSVLSDHSVIIYWMNASEERLIKPVFTCFAAYTYYSIGATVGAGVAVFQQDLILFTGYFCANVVVLILLTISMIDVYFGRDMKKKKMRAQLGNDYSAYEQWHDKADISVYRRNQIERYEKAMLGLRQNIFQADAQGDQSVLREIYELYFSATASFDSLPGKSAVQALVSTVNERTFPTFRVCLENYLLEMPYIKKHEFTMFRDDVDEYHRYWWYMDEEFWYALSRNSYLRSWIEGLDMECDDLEELMLLVRLLKHRLMHLHNDMVEKKDKEDEQWNGSSYLLRMEPEGKIVGEQAGEPVTPAQVREILTFEREKDNDNKSFLTPFLRMIAIMVQREDLRPIITEAMADLPVVNICAEEAERFGLKAQEITALRDSFPPMK